MRFIFNTDSITPDSGSGGGSSAVIDALTITPSTTKQTITATSGIDGYSPITVNAVTASIDNNIIASNIISGVSILGVNGSATVLNGEIVNITPSTSAQTITPTSPKNGIIQANVAAVTSAIDANIIAENIKKDVTILNVVGTYEGSGGGASNGDFYVMIAPSGSNYNKLTSFVINGVDYKQKIFDAFDLGTLPGSIKRYKISLPLGSSYNYSFTCSSGYAPIDGKTSGTINFTNKISQLYQIILEEEY